MLLHRRYVGSDLIPTYLTYYLPTYLPAYCVQDLLLFHA